MSTKTQISSAEYHAAGARPDALIPHVIKSYDIAGITPEDFIKHYASEQFDYEELKKEFKKHCHDYNEDLVSNIGSKALEFCGKILFEVEPETRKVKKGQANKVWKFIFKYEDVKHVVMVEKGSRYNKVFGSNYLVLSVKQAGLISMDTFARLTKFAASMPSPQYMLTPRAGAIFSRDDLPVMAKELGHSVAELVTMINQSCQSGGHYLSKSNANIAICASISATRNLKEASMRDVVVFNVTKQYISRNKKPELTEFQTVAKFATGGVPHEFQYERLVEEFDKSQTIRINGMAVLKAIRSSMIKTIVVEPSATPNTDPAPGDLPPALKK